MCFKYNEVIIRRNENSIICHSIWNIIVVVQIFEVVSNDNELSIFLYKLNSNELVITGGKFGIESSIISVIAYSMVILYAIYFMKIKKLSKEWVK